MLILVLLRSGIRMIKDDRVKGEDLRGAFARGKDTSDKVDIRRNAPAGQIGGVDGLYDEGF
jgi:hypothetical protein